MKYILTVIHATCNAGSVTEEMEFDMFYEMQDYIIENNIENYRIGVGV